MKAVLDHVGIAISDLPAALAFYRDALGLDVEGAEDVGSQRVKAHFIPAGDPKLELLEATSPDSTIAKYVEKRGAGLHHITFRVENLEAALAHLKARGVRLIDETPRPGAEHAMVAFIHPSATHGVLVELKQPPPPGRITSRRSDVRRFTVGDLELVSLNDGFIELDGGAMFGSVPKPLWERRIQPDDRNRITLAMRPLVVRGEKTMLIDAGLGDKETGKFCEIYGVERSRNLEHTLADAGLGPDDIDLVLASHLHFDHAGGFTKAGGGKIVPRFPRAQYIIRRGEWEDATHPHERNRASYLEHNFVPLADAGVVRFIDDDQVIMPGVRVQRTGGHTMHHQIALIESGGQSAAFIADLIPMTPHLPDAWIMGYDLYPMDTLRAKQAFLRQAIDRHTLVFFEHDPAIAAAYITEEKGRPTLHHV